MNMVKKIFGSVDIGYLIKSYIFSIIMIYLCLNDIDKSPSVVFVAILNGILFPFSALLWDTLSDLIMGNNMIILPLPMMLVWKFIKIFLLYIFAIIIAPLGIIYIIIRNKYFERVNN
ncbi:MAG: hypothetical protein RR912_09920 [Clostridium sp.]